MEGKARPTGGQQLQDREQKLRALASHPIFPLHAFSYAPLLHMASKLPPTPPETATSIYRASCPPESSESSLVSDSDSEGLLLLSSSGPGETLELVCKRQRLSAHCMSHH